MVGAVMVSGEQSEYDRGVAAGSVLSRLDSHDKQLARINGSMERVADKLAKLESLDQAMLLAVQRLGDAASADRATVVTTAEALEKAEAARRDKTESRWSPMARLITVIVAIAVVAGVVIAWISLTRAGGKP
jgi:t-SNARE complex subunit (syntaxin)